MTLEAATVTPERMHLVDLRTGEDRTAFFNPSQLEEQVSVNYARQTIPGLSHQPLQYVNTNNHGIELDLYAAGHSVTERQLMDDWRRFLLSLCYASESADSIQNGAPPSVLFIWPRVFSMRIRIMSVRIVHKDFVIGGETRRWAAAISFEEDRSARITSEEVRRLGTRRSYSGGGGEAP